MPVNFVLQFFKKFNIYEVRVNKNGRACSPCRNLEITVMTKSPPLILTNFYHIPFSLSIFAAASSRACFGVFLPRNASTFESQIMFDISAHSAMRGQPFAFPAASINTWYRGVWNCGSFPADMVTGGKPTASSNLPFHSSL